MFGPLASTLWSFITPELGPTPASLPVRAVFALGVTAWNLPFFSASRRNAIVSGVSAHHSSWLFDLYVRRLQHYPNDPRMVVAYDLIELDSGGLSPLVEWVEAAFQLERLERRKGA